ncbi:MAG: hypothetical protein L0H41_15650 [Microlunatus sp.]|nr:hypothetical protein [Intrasporangium sp.]MDN5759625.1 hypothetical protein [Tomitella sp.]MDN5763737.1 hypothetical protein [Microlunatus sp.]MDN5796765.1 hypothetical protein [Intrasporangium sp.]
MSTSKGAEAWQGRTAQGGHRKRRSEHDVAGGEAPIDRLRGSLAATRVPVPPAEVDGNGKCKGREQYQGAPERQDAADADQHQGSKEDLNPWKPGSEGLYQPNRQQLVVCQIEGEPADAQLGGTGVDEGDPDSYLHEEGKQGHFQPSLRPTTVS